MKTTFRFIVALLLICSSTRANVKLPSIIGDNMVLQQSTNAKVWGWAEPGEKIDLTASWEKKAVTTKADAKGHWIVDLPTPKAGGPYTLIIEGKNKIEVKNILIGEVWICSGQSNMHYPVGPTDKSWNKGVVNYQSVLADANYPQIRLFTVARKTAEIPQTDCIGKWEVCDQTTIFEFSGVGYFFGHEIFTQTNQPVGMINSSWGGTPAEAWTRRELLENDTLLSPIIDRNKKLVGEYPAIKKAYEERLRKWKQDVADSVIRGDEAKIPPKAPAAPGPHKAPYVLYNAMIAPIIPYTIKGVVWYQGEANADHAWQYRHLFPTMIDNWRDDWKQGDFPFYFVQIAPHRSQNPEIREAQLLTYRSVPNTGMVVITDAGDSTNIHPTNKQVVGYRLSLWALAKNYGRTNLCFSGPMYKSMKIEGSKIRISFDYPGLGLVCKGDSLTHFAIAGADRQFVKAQAKIDGNTVVVYSSQVSNPVAVRFGWENIPMPNFYNKEGLPASPFRTDSWPEKTFGKK
jgi:sialate O-acetylesterase